MPPSRRGLVAPLALAAMCLAPNSPAAESEPAGADLPEGPGFKEVLSVPAIGSVATSPDGSAVVYEVRSADWEENRYDTELWLASPDAEPFQLTRTREEGSHDPAFSPDGRWVAFLADRGDATQIHLLPTRGGEARQLTAVEDGVESFEWAPDGKAMAVAITEPLSEDLEKRSEAYGDFAVEDATFQMTHLWILDVDMALAKEAGAALPPEGEDSDEDPGGGSDEGDDDDGKEDAAENDDGGESPPALRRLTSGDRFTVNDYQFSPDGSRIAFSHQPDTRVESFENSDISLVVIDTGAVSSLVDRPAHDGNPIWSPDGAWVLFDTADGDFNYFVNGELARIAADGGEIEVLTEEFDEDPSALAWLADGIRFIALDGATRRVFQLDASSGTVSPLTDEPPTVWSVDVSRDGKRMAFGGEGADRIEEVYLADVDGSHAVRLTDQTAEIAEWATGDRQMIRWASRDGAEIEGVLLTPPASIGRRNIPCWSSSTAARPGCRCHRSSTVTSTRCSSGSPRAR